MSAELERLKEKVRRDPNSRLFISLADLYRKEGMLEEAVQVLTDGLERQPDYMSARVALGKIYLEENRLDSALTEFSLVAKAIPENLFAQRKLADIYMMMEDAERAKTALETVVRLNPLDKEAVEALERLRGGVLTDPSGEDGLPREIGTEEESENPFVPEGDGAWEGPEKGHGPGVETGAEEVERAMDFLGEDGLPDGLSAEALLVQRAASEEFGGPEEGKNKDSSEEKGPEDSQDISDWFEEPAGPIPSGAANDGDPEQEGHADLSFGGLLEEELDRAKGEGAEFQTVSDEVPAGEDGVSASSGEGWQDEKEKATGDDDLERADELVHNGQYALGFMVLRRRLESFPDDTSTLQRFEELKVLIKLLGLENEVRASMLDSFLQSAQKRKSPSENRQDQE